jgi:hypothetical protein
MDAAAWIEGRHEGDGFRGHLARSIRQWLYLALEFAPYWMARQRLAERTGAKLPEYEGHLSAIVHQPADTGVVTTDIKDRLANYTPLPANRRAEVKAASAELIAEIEASPEAVRAALRAIYYDPAPPRITFDNTPAFAAYLEQFPDPARARKDCDDDCRSWMERAGLLTGAAGVRRAVAYWLNLLRAKSKFFHRAEKGGWITDWIWPPSTC